MNGSPQLIFAMREDVFTALIVQPHAYAQAPVEAGQPNRMARMVDLFAKTLYSLASVQTSDAQKQMQK